MSGFLLYSVFDFPTDSLLRDSATVAGFLTQIVDQTEFKVVVPDTYGFPPQLIQDSSGIEDTWNHVVQKGGTPWSVRLWSRPVLDLFFGIDPSHCRQLDLVVSSDDVLTSEFAEEKMRVFISLCEFVFNKLQPAYGYGLIDSSLRSSVSPGANPKILHDLNFFGCHLARSLGIRQRVSPHAFRTVDYYNGGVLVQMVSPNPEYDFPRANYEAAAKALGMDRYCHWGNVWDVE